VKRHTGSFRARDAVGRERVIHVYTNFVDTTTSHGPGQGAGMKELRTDDGGHVNRIR
jgi:hypothetical protein